MTNHVLWGMGLFVVAIVLVALELFIPSGGIIAVTAIVVTIAGIVAFFRESTSWGVSSIGVALVLTPIVVHYAFKLMPHTPIGRRLILGEPDEDEQHRKAIQEQQRLDEEQALVGMTGVALTDLRPVGSAQIEGSRVEVLAEGGVIPAGASIRVTAVQGNVVKVRKQS